MSNDNNNQAAWEKEIKKHVQLYPNERIVAFLARNYKFIEENYSKKALDIGFGSGRHLKLLLEYGFNTYGLDYLEECKKVAEGILGEEAKLKTLLVGDFKDKPFGNTLFDVIILWGVIFLRNREEIERDLKILNEMITQHGKVFLNFRTKEDSLYKKGKEVMEDTYILEHPTYKGMTYTFFDEIEVREIVGQAGFKVEYIEREEYWKNNLTERHSWWVLALSKK